MGTPPRRADKTMLVASDLTSSETYARDCRGWQALAHRAARTVHIGPNAILAFEDALTVRHQLQEMLRVEQISVPALVQAEIDAFASLIPGGSSLKATFMLEYADASQRRTRGPGLVGIERGVWVRVEGWARTFACVDPSAQGRAVPLTHRLTFELGKSGLRDLANGSRLSVGIDHGDYHAVLVLSDLQRDLLLKDLH